MIQGQSPWLGSLGAVASTGERGQASGGEGQEGECMGEALLPVFYPNVLFYFPAIFMNENSCFQSLVCRESVVFVEKVNSRTHFFFF